MKILFEHSSQPLPIQKYGGTERQLFWLMKALVEQGQDVYLIGHRESQVSHIGVQLIPRTADDWTSQIPKKIEIIHLFYNPSFPLPKPTLVTIEGNGKPGEVFPLNTVFVSKKHAALHGSTHYVYNGVDLSEYPYQPPLKNHWDQFLFLAKAKWKVKNLKGCVTACRKTKKHLHIGGGRWWGFSRYIHSYGMVNQAQKQSLFKKTHALLFPVLWDEPFGIAMIEAMAMGLPVIGSCFGSLPEIIPPEGGVLCKNQAELEQAVTECPRSFNPNTIRRWIETHFSSQQSANQYRKFYEKILSGETLHSTPPQTTPHAFLHSF